MTVTPNSKDVAQIITALEAPIRVCRNVKLIREHLLCCQADFPHPVANRLIAAVRHRFTNYDAILDAMQGEERDEFGERERVGNEAYTILKRRVNAEIRRYHGSLLGEIEQQIVSARGPSPLPKAGDWTEQQVAACRAYLAEDVASDAAVKLSDQEFLAVYRALRLSAERPSGCAWGKRYKAIQARAWAKANIPPRSLQGQRKRYRATVTHYSAVPDYRGDRVEVRLTDLVLVETGEVVSDHAFFNLTKALAKLHLLLGAVLEFDACAERLWFLKRPTKLKLIERGDGDLETDPSVVYWLERLREG